MLWTTEGEMVGWHHQLNGHEFEQTLGDSEGQRSLLCCNPWSGRVRHPLAAEQQQNSGYNSLCCKKRPCCSSILHMCVCVSHSGMSNSLWLRVQKPARLLCPWDFPGKNTGVGYHFLLQGIFPTQELNPGLLHCRQILHSLSHRVSSS